MSYTDYVNRVVWGNRMKVLQINSVCGISSTGRIAIDIHNSLIERGFGSYIAFGRDIKKL